MARNIPVQMLKSVRQPAAVIDDSYSYTFVNEAFCEYHQILKEETIGRHVEQITGQKNFRDQIKPHLDHCLTGEEVNFTFKPNGSENRDTIREIHLYPCFSDEGSVDSVVAISEIQGTSESLRELREREKRFCLLAEYSTDIVYTTDLYQRFTFISPSVEKILGYTVDEALNMNARDIMTEASYQEQLEAFRKVLGDPNTNSETTEIKTLELIRKDGTKIWGEVNARLLLDQSKQPSGVLGICRDITRRKKDEEHRRNVMWLSQSALDFLELETVEDIYQYIGENLHKLVPQSASIISYVDEEENIVTTRYVFGIKKSRFARVVELMGLNPIGKQFHLDQDFKMVYKKQRLVRSEEGIKDFARGYVSGKVARQIERLFNLKSIYTIGLRKGDRLFSAIHIFKFNTPEIQYFDMVETFLSQASIALQRKMLENELWEAKEKAEENERLKTAFLANLSHEIRTPLNIILGYVQLLDKPDLSSENRKLYIDAIHNSSDHLIDIIDDVLSMAKLDTGQQSLQINPFNLNSLIHETYSSFEPKASRNNIHFNTCIPNQNNSHVIRSDENKVRQILANLLNNAFKFTPEGGEISFGYSLDNGDVRFFVKDTGIGISSEHQERIFERFTQVEHSSKRKYEGTGLGLPISRGLVELLGGDIQVESKPDKGSIFSFVIPAGEGDE